MTRANQIDETTSPVVTGLYIKVALPGSSSLKEKRGRLLRIINGIRQRFNVSVAEIGFNDNWQTSIIGCAILSNSARYNLEVAENILKTIESCFPDEPVENYQIEAR